MTKEKAKTQLPAEVHTHFRKANVLHGYVQQSLGEASKHALETGQELLAAKKAIPHGGWESECDRLFDGSARTAQFYMSFAKDVAAIKSAPTRALLMLEGTLKGAAAAAKKAAHPTPAKKSPPKPAPPPEEEEEDPFAEEAIDYGKCPACAGTEWDADDDVVCCAKCRHPHGEPAGDVDEERLKTQRQKTVKTAEALMRAFDDLQLMRAKPEYEDIIDTCKELLAAAKGWK